MRSVETTSARQFGFEMRRYIVEVMEANMRISIAKGAAVGNTHRCCSAAVRNSDTCGTHARPFRAAGGVPREPASPAHLSADKRNAFTCTSKGIDGPTARRVYQARTYLLSSTLTSVFCLQFGLCFAPGWLSRKLNESVPQLLNTDEAVTVPSRHRRCGINQGNYASSSWQRLHCSIVVWYKNNLPLQGYVPYNSATV